MLVVLKNNVSEGVEVIDTCVIHVGDREGVAAVWDGERVAVWDWERLCVTQEV